MTGDLKVEDGVTLTIAPGVAVEFQDYYGLAVRGTLLAVGTPSEPILFTTDEPNLFQIDGSLSGCWNGIEFLDTSSTNRASRLEHCVLEYGKAVTASGAPYEYAGGALSLFDFSKLTVKSCVLRHNVAEYGGAIFLYHNSNPLLESNLFVDNHALVNASAVYSGYSYPRLRHNTVVDNPIHNDFSYVDSCAVLNFLGKPLFENGLFWGNDPALWQIHSQLWENKDYYTDRNLIEGYGTSAQNLDADPRFVDELAGDYRLTAASPAVNLGLECGAQATDLDGNPRIVMGGPDLGAYELGGPLRLEADVFALSAAAGGTVQLDLHAGAAEAGRPYLVLVSASGPLPGTPLAGPSGYVILPLGWDLFTDVGLLLTNGPNLPGFLGILDGAGNGQASFVLPPGTSAAGIELSFAYLLGPIDFVSNPVSLRFDP